MSLGGGYWCNPVSVVSLGGHWCNPVSPVSPVSLGGHWWHWVLTGVPGVLAQATRNTGKSIANRNIANPTAALLAACMMLDHLRWAGPGLGGGRGHTRAGRGVGDAVAPGSLRGWAEPWGLWAGF